MNDRDARDLAASLTFGALVLRDPDLLAAIADAVEHVPSPDDPDRLPIEALGAPQ